MRGQQTPSGPREEPRRTQALRAALQVLGDEGLRALTHARVDSAAALPKGTTSNYFRTRQALLEGVTKYLAQQEQADFGLGGPVTHREQAIDAFVDMLEAQVNPHRHRTLARYALFVNATHDQELLAPLLANRKGFEHWTTGILAGLGAPTPLEATTFLMATLDGLLLHRLTVDQQLKFRPHVVRALDSCTTGEGHPGS